MQVSIINNLKQFQQLKTNWDAVYSADPNAQIFVSWSWLRSWFEVTPYAWSILAIQLDRNSPYIAFFPIALRSVKKCKIHVFRELHMGGYYLADYTGFVCLPEYEEQAITTFAIYLQQHFKWDSFQLTDVSDPRLDIFLKCFSQKKFNFHQANATCCPYIPLPTTWEQYLQDFLGANTRQNLRKKLRQIESLKEFNFIPTQANNLEIQIEALLKLWQMRWGVRSESELNIYRNIFQRCFENDCLWLNVLWNETTPVAGIAIFMEQQKKVFYFYITGYDDNFSKLSPGRVMLAHSIKYAIENGFEVFDFLRGDEDYKFSFFGAKERYNKNVTIERRNLRITAINLIKQLRQFSKKTKTDVAEEKTPLPQQPELSS